MKKIEVENLWREQKKHEMIYSKIQQQVPRH